MEYDEIIVGAGSSGAVLASRLSEDPERSVLLLEAGPDYPNAEQIPADLQNAQQLSLFAHDWKYEAHFSGDRPDGPLWRGKVTGGSSSVNGCVALRGTPGDYDEWAEMGNPAWAWPKVLPYFRKLEDDADFHDDIHGTGGPIHIKRYRPEEYTTFTRAVYESAQNLGFEASPDQNHPEATGVGSFPSNQRNGLRISTAVGYLLPARHRLNLTVRGDVLVNRILFDGTRAIGVEALCGGEMQRVYGKRITLSAGAIATPPILMRSGIGPAKHLAAMGIPVLRDMPGVGANLSDHPGSGISFLLTPEGVEGEMPPFTQLVVRYTADGSDIFNDMQLWTFNQIYGSRAPSPDTDAEPQYIGSLTAALQKTDTRGTIRLRSADPEEQPAIDLNFCDEPEDMWRLIQGVRLAWKVLHQPELEPLVAQIPGISQDVIDSDEAMEAYVRSTVGSMAHPVGTARMGPASDPAAVVDERGRVHGFEGLQVVDASVMPTVPRANTNLTCIMIGERVADWMREG